MIITSASNDELTNLGQCRLCFKLGEETFEYYFQIIKNLKRDLILGLSFQKTFKISQDITDSNDLYLHIRNKIITFSTQSTNKKNAYRSNLKTGNSSESKLPEISNPESSTKLTSMETDSLKALYH